MSQLEQQFREHLDRSSAIYSRWPKWKQRLGLLGPPHVYDKHISPNDAQPGSQVHDAEEWWLGQGMLIPVQAKHPSSFQGMLDDYARTLD